MLAVGNTVGGPIDPEVYRVFEQEEFEENWEHFELPDTRQPDIIIYS